MDSGPAPGTNKRARFYCCILIYSSHWRNNVPGIMRSWHLGNEGGAGHTSLEARAHYGYTVQEADPNTREHVRLLSSLSGCAPDQSLRGSLSSRSKEPRTPWQVLQFAYVLEILSANPTLSFHRPFPYRHDERRDHKNCGARVMRHYWHQSSSLNGTVGNTLQRESLHSMTILGPCSLLGSHANCIHISDRSSD